ncbi:MAG: zinc ribbon domain-containing protein [Patescibacteria group bacterium]|nr:zinc ribbon domain-containing protein [Patescibacteria group bacterium]
MQCSKCKAEVLPEYYFCPNCGKKLREKPIATSALMQIGVYLVCIFLPPLGLYYTYRYFKLGTRDGVIIAWVTIILTVASLWISWVLLQDVWNTYTQYLNAYTGLGLY